MANLKTCPTQAELRDLLLGKSSNAVGEHLLDCPVCGANAGRLVASDPLLADLRAAHDTSEIGTDGTFIEDLLRRVKRPSAKSPDTDDEVNLSFLDPPLPNFPTDLGMFNHYRIVEKLGQGGMGLVFRAVDTNLDRTVALKIILPKYAANKKLRDRFLEEARATVKVRSPHVAEVYETNVWRDVPYLTMELLDGQTLDRKAKPMPLESLRRIAYGIAKGLSDAHRSGMIHRDLKPSNIHLGTDARTGKPTVKLIDFGLARPVDRAVEVTKSGELLGTPAYMSPEQARGRKVDHRTDLYSLGVILFQLATGKLPYPTDGGVMGILTVLATPEPLDSVTVHGAMLPSSLSALIDQLLAKNPEQRPASADEVMKVLKASLTEKGDVAVSSAYVSMGDATASVDVAMSAPFADIETSPLTNEATVEFRSKPKRPAWLWPAVGVGSLALAAVLIVLGIGLMKVKTKDGTIVLSDLPEDAEVLVDGSTVKVAWNDGDDSAEIRIPAGTRKIEVKVNGTTVSGETVTLAAGETKPITVQYEAEPEAVAPAAVPAVATAAGVVESAELVKNGDFEDPVLLSWVTDSGKWHRRGVAPNSILCAGECRIGVLHQSIDVSKYATEIDAGRVQFKVSCLLSSFDADRSRLQLVFQDKDEKHLAIGYDTGEKAHRMKWVEYGDTVTPPAGTRFARIVLRSTLTPRPGNKENSGYYDKVSLKALVTKAAPASAPPIDRNRFEVQFGKWSIVGDELAQTDATAPFAFLRFGDPDWTDYDFQVDVKRTGGNEQVALQFRRKAPREFYLFGLGTWENTEGVVDWQQDGKSGHLLRFNHKLPSNEWHTMLVKVRGSKITCTLDPGTSKALSWEAEDGRHSKGMVGLRTAASQYRFRNISVKAPDGAILWEGLPNVGNGPAASRAAVSQQGKVRLEGDELSIEPENSPGAASVGFGDPAWTDYDLTADVKGDGFLYARVTDRDNFWVYEARPEASAYTTELRVKAKGDFTSAGETKNILNTKADGWNRMKLSVRGLEAVCYFNDREVGRMTNDRNPKGYVGLGAFRGEARFRNVIVKAPDGKELYKGFPDLAPPATASSKEIEEAHVLKLHQNPATRVRFTPDGTRLVSSSNGDHHTITNNVRYHTQGTDNSVRVWDVRTGAQVYHFPMNTGYRYGPQGIDLSRDGRLLAVSAGWYTANGPAEPRVYVYDLTTGQRKHVLIAPRDSAIRGVTFADGDAAITTARSGREGLNSWSTAGVEKPTVNLEDIPGGIEAPNLEFSKGGEFLLGGRFGGSGPLVLWDCKTGKELKEFLGHTKQVTFAVLSPNGQRVLSCSGDKTVRTWDRTTGKQLLSLTFASPATCVAYSPDGSRFATGHEDGSIEVRDASTGFETIRHPTAHVGAVRDVTFDPTGMSLATAGHDTTVRIWKLRLPTSTGFVPLFNGKDLTGWEPHPTYPGQWMVNNGVLQGKALTGLAGQQARSYLRTTRKDFTDFHLRAEARINRGGSGGIFFRVGDSGEIFPSATDRWIAGYQVDIEAKRGTPTWTGGLMCGNYILSPPNGPTAEPDEWFVLDLIVSGREFTVKVNDRLVNRYTDMVRKSDKGFISLHAFLTTSLPEFRKIEIQELPPAKVTRIAPPAAPVSPTNGKPLATTGTIRIEGKELTIDSANEPGFGRIAFGDPKWTDFDLEVEVTGKAYAFFRTTDTSNFRHFGVQPNGSGLAAFAAIGTQGTVTHSLKNFEIPDADSSGWNRLKVVMRGNESVFFINGREVGRRTDTSNPEGFIALGAFQGTARFRNLLVTAPDGTVLYRGFPDLAPAPAPSPPAANGFVSLFNGKDLTGWEKYGFPKGSWTVENGELVGQCPANKLNDGSNLVTVRKDYRNFHLKMQVQKPSTATRKNPSRVVFLPGAKDDGVNGYFKVYLGTPENENGKEIGRLAREKDENLPLIFTPNILAKSWYTLEIKVEGNRVQVFVEGLKTAEVTDDAMPAQGHPINLTCAQEGTVRFRNIEIRELPSPAPPAVAPPKPKEPAKDPNLLPLFNGKDLTGWEAFGNPNAAWTVENGVLTGRWKNADVTGGSTLATTGKEFRNFRLRIEAQASETEASRIFCLPGPNPNGIGGYFKVWLGSPRGNMGEEVGRVTMRIKDDMPLLAKSKVAAGEWFKLDLVVRGNRVITYVDSVKTTDVTDDKLPAAGHSIGLGLAAGGTLRIRSVEIEELRP